MNKIDKLREKVALLRKDSEEVVAFAIQNKWTVFKIEVIQWGYNQRILSINQQIASLRKKEAKTV